MGRQRRILPKIKKGAKPVGADFTPGSKNEPHNNSVNQNDKPRKRKLPVTVKGWVKFFRSLDYSVFPVVKGTKKPKCPWKEFQVQLATDAEIMAMFGAFDCSIGIVTGKISGIVVVDLDSPEAVQFAKDNGFFYNTPRVKTAKGYHLYFEYKKGVRNFQGRADLPDIDLRGDGGFVVAPPSIHESGHEYTWEEGCSPLDMPLGGFPEMLLAKDKSEKRSVADIKAHGSDKGSRNNDTTVLAGHYVGKDLSLEDMTTKLLDHNKNKNRPPLPDDEVKKIAESIFNKHQESGSTDRGPGIVAYLIKRMTEGDFTYFYDQTNIAHARLNTSKYYEVLPLESQRVKLFIGMICYRELGIPAKDVITKEVISFLTSKAFFEGEQYELSYRATTLDGVIWIDLGDTEYRAVNVNPEGWFVLESEGVPILFRRYAHMKPLPVPVTGGSLDDLKQLIHVKNEDIWILLQVWLVTAFIPNIPRPGLVFHGLHGAGKSIAGLLLRSLIDPSEIALLPTPTRLEELLLQLNNNFLVVFDNLQFLKPWMSDSLCRAVTGGGFAKRKLYTDNDEIIFSFKTPFILNGISNPAGMSDLLDRSILIELGRIPKNQRKTESEIMAVFAEVAPGILGAMFDALSTTLRTKDDFQLHQVPRMADWAKYGYAAAEALGIGGDRFLEAYEANCLLQHYEVIFGDPVASTIKALAEDHSGISDTPSVIYRKCKTYLEEGEERAKSWPQNAAHFSRRLKVASNNLREIGVLVDFSRDKERVITIKLKS